MRGKGGRGGERKRVSEREGGGIGVGERKG